MDIDNETHHDEHAISICGSSPPNPFLKPAQSILTLIFHPAFAADIMSHLDNDNASPSSFAAWMQETDISQTLSATMKTLSLVISRLAFFSARSLRLLDSSATALWNAFVRFLRGVGGDDFKGEVVRGMYILCRSGG